MKADKILLAYHHIHVIKHLTINAKPANASITTTTSLFTVTGLVRVSMLLGLVETATLGSNVTDCWFDLFPTGGNSVPLTKENGAPAMTAFEVGSAIIKSREAAQIASVLQANVGMFLEEDAVYKHPYKSFLVGKDSDAATYIRFMYTTTADLSAQTGVIHFEAIYEPISNGAKLEPL